MWFACVPGVHVWSSVWWDLKEVAPSGLALGALVVTHVGASWFPRGGENKRTNLVTPWFHSLPSCPVLALSTHARQEVL